MTDLIAFTDEEFSFRLDGVAYHVHTEVGGNVPARVVVEELKPEPVDQEPSE